MADGEEVLTKVKLAEAPGARGFPELLTHMMEFPLTSLTQLSEFPALDGFEARLFPLAVQPYQKLLRALVPVFWSVIV